MEACLKSASDSLLVAQGQVCVCSLSGEENTLYALNEI